VKNYTMNPWSGGVLPSLVGRWPFRLISSIILPIGHNQWS
jgi:hypothetical protein